MSLKQEIAEYERMHEELEAKHFSKWVVIHDKKLYGVYDEFEDAADAATQAFGRGPYLIRQAGVPVPPLPASLMYRPVPAE